MESACLTIASDFLADPLTLGSPDWHFAHLRSNPGPQISVFEVPMKQILFIVSAVAAAGIIAFTASANIEDNSQTLSQVSGYKQWTRINDEPIKVEIPPGLPVIEVAV